MKGSAYTPNYKASIDATLTFDTFYHIGANVDILLPRLDSMNCIDVEWLRQWNLTFVIWTLI